MADGPGQQDIRGTHIQKLVVGFGETEINMKKVCNIVTTPHREVRFFRKTSGFLDSADTTAITASQIYNTSERALPVVVEQSWTRVTKYVQKYFVESPTMSIEDLRDATPDVLAATVRDLVRAVSNQVDERIYTIITTDNGNTAASTAAWDAASGQNIIKDLMNGKRLIEVDGYNTQGAWLLLSPLDHQSLVTELINVKGSMIPNWSSEKINGGEVMNILGLKVLVSTAVDADECAIVVPKRCMTWYSFMPLTSYIIDDPGIGKKIRVLEEGVPVMTDVDASFVLTNTQA